MRTKQKTPQEKKALSYAKDRRNSYGENDKASRKSIPLHKAKQNRSYRKSANQVLDTIINETDPENINLIESKVLNVRKGNWKKYPDAPLGKIIEAKIKNRKLHAGKGKTARKKERELIEKLQFNAYQLSPEVWTAEVIGFSNLKVKGKTEKEALGKIKILAKVAAQNAAGLDVKILLDGILIKPILEVEQGR